MKIPLIYPKIPENTNKFVNQCYAFEKLDGTNCHFVWTPEDGFHLFGTRRTQFSFTKPGIKEFIQTHSELANVPDVFNDKFRDKLNSIYSRANVFNKTLITKAIIYAEFYGPNSFAGAHDELDQANDLQTLTIIDVSVNGKLVEPILLVADYTEIYQLDVAPLVYSGKYTGQFTNDVRDGKYPVNEGVVVKSVAHNEVLMTKIKTKDYLKRLEKR